ncbi:P-loop containing nucleoside triphosphate hydrolase protein [Suillus lakei]|nr:P-loop containing nucleoside triphosphate hydrolase protein [Suillus lakei]
MTAFQLFLASLEDDGHQKSPRRTTDVARSSALKASKSVRLSSALPNLKHVEITPPVSANISREFVLATPKEPKPSNAANIGGSVPDSSFALFNHQAMDLEWLLAREKAGQGGSILAHDVAKTVTSIALIKKTLQESKAADLKKLPGISAKIRGSGKAPFERPNTTLLCLTGTPFVNKLSDIQPQLRFLEVTDERGPAAESTAFAVRGKRGYFSKVSAHVVAGLLADCVLGQIIEEQGLDAHVTSDAEDMYGRGLDPDPKVLPLNLQPFARLFGHAFVSGKIRVVVDIIIGVSEGQKVMVFCCFRDTMDLLEAQMKKLKIGIDQRELSTKQRMEVLDSFTNNPRMKVLLMFIDAGGVGLNITVANHVILVNP